MRQDGAAQPRNPSQFYTKTIKGSRTSTAQVLHDSFFSGTPEKLVRTDTLQRGPAGPYYE